MNSRTLGFIGLGVMGSAMASHLKASGERLCINTRSKDKALSLLQMGAEWCDSYKEIARKCDVIFTMVGYPSDVEDIYFGHGGLIENVQPGSVLVDMTTSRPDLAVRIYLASKEKGIYALDAPVSGGDIGAKNASLSIMVGGEASIFERIRPLFETMGKTIVLQGGPGTGQHTKMANQIAVAGSLLGATEAISYAKRAGLDSHILLRSIQNGSAQSWQLTNNAPRMLNGDFNPGFYVKHFLKDLRIALDAAHSMEIELPILEQAERLFAKLAAEGMGNYGTQAIYQLYERGLA